MPSYVMLTRGERWWCHVTRDIWWRSCLQCFRGNGKLWWVDTPFLCLVMSLGRWRLLGTSIYFVVFEGFLMVDFTRGFDIDVFYTWDFWWWILHEVFVFKWFDDDSMVVLKMRFLDWDDDFRSWCWDFVIWSCTDKIIPCYIKRFKSWTWWFFIFFIYGNREKIWCSWFD